MSEKAVEVNVTGDAEVWASLPDGRRVRVVLCACEKCGAVYINPEYAGAHESKCKREG